MFYYYAFEIMTLIHLLLSLVIDVIVIVTQDFKPNWLVWVMTVISVFLTLVMSFLVCRQTSFLSDGITLWEYMRGVKKDKMFFFDGNVYDQGCW